MIFVFVARLDATEYPSHATSDIAILQALLCVSHVQDPANKQASQASLADSWKVRTSWYHLDLEKSRGILYRPVLISSSTPFKSQP
mmetsp:Transcript_7603/g.13942  ORF Transcript_7603/g.13942 Transcript_7603/m.13942 type:complete len:86 (+) Transcript_7603:170-427(+)